MKYYGNLIFSVCLPNYIVNCGNIKNSSIIKPKQTFLFKTLTLFLMNFPKFYFKV